MATGMVLVIVTRHIDLSVGSLLGFTAMIMVLGLGHPMIWVITVIVGVLFGTLIGAFQGFLIAYLSIPAFIVTLGGLLIWRGASYLVARGETIAPVDQTFSLIGEEGLFISHGFAIPILVAIAVGIAMTFLATRTRFGRYVFAIGGNPEAAELAGINTKKMTMMIFALMGGLTGIAAVIASARLKSATLALGQFDELYVIAAAVIGGTSFAGGIGTIYGAIL
ncbi:UNVERIFIED_CONTAM: hypothetical protein GTU68_053311, partial [Idotea baltica]|nr:hypothetical protein [Idotea baltica]